MKTETYYTLVKVREDGDFEVLACFNANTGDDEMDQVVAETAKNTLESYQQWGGVWNYRLLERQDIPDLLDGSEVTAPHPGYGTAG